MLSRKSTKYESEIIRFIANIKPLITDKSCLGTNLFSIFNTDTVKSA